MVEETMELTVIVERRETANRWQSIAWRAVEVRPRRDDDVAGTPAGGDGPVKRFVAGSLPLTLHRATAEMYLFNLSGAGPPSIYVVMTLPKAEGEHPTPVLLTADPYEGQAYTYDDRLVDGVPMPPLIQDWLRAFIAVHYKEQPFLKRKRDAD